MYSPSRIVVLGSGGLLGSAFVDRLNSSNTLLTIGRDLLATGIPDQALAKIVAFGPDIVINCAGDTNVESGEGRRLEVYRANAILPGLLAHASKRVHARFVHFSSTGCYGAWKSDPYSDFDRLEPTTVHHSAKLAGEADVRSSGAEALIFRLGWLFGGSGKKIDFVRARLAEARGKAEIFSDPSQTGCPTFIGDVVEQTLRALAYNISGVFNCVGENPATRYDYVATILQLAGVQTRLIPKKFDRRAAVSSNEAALNEKLSVLGINVMRPWKEALARYLDDREFS